ncbi:MAG: cytochrome c [Gammaproteobacteria bacterium]|jgi:mono/diheme cytochrome c family protein|nr:cytochrome c [Gammaproteobacteria bacterium]MDP6734193.1 cytochrome c [Gammaproteobacteria bacterium]
MIVDETRSFAVRAAEPGGLVILSCRTLAIYLLGLAACSAATPEQVTPTLTEETIIWDGAYTDDQARRGQRVYQQACAECHLGDLSGDGDAPALIGAPFFYRWSDLSIGDLVTAIRTTMPKGAPGSLSPAGYVDLSAYLLEKNMAPSGNTELPIDLDKLWNIVITEANQ